jgi:hypothetical protein
VTTTTPDHAVHGVPDNRPDAITRVLEALIILELVIFMALVAAYIIVAIA